jgi:DNA-binding transcriptional LysR family regulator
MSRRTLDSKQLAILLDVVRFGSFSKAAQERSISQPAISSTISALERRLGVQLLERNRAGVKATPAGMILVRRAEGLENQLDLAEREIMLSQAGIYGPLRVFGAPGALLTLLPSTISALARQATRLDLSIVEANDPELVEMLRIEKADIVLSTLGAGPTYDDIEDIDLLTDIMVVVMRPGHDLTKCNTVTLATLQDASWVLPGLGGAFRRHADALLINAGLQIKGSVIRCDSLGLLKDIVQHTDYLALLPEGVVRSDVAYAKLATRPIDQKVTRRLGMRILSRNHSSPAINNLMQALREAAAAPHL